MSPASASAVWVLFPRRQQNFKVHIKPTMSILAYQAIFFKADKVFVSICLAEIKRSQNSFVYQGESSEE